MAAGCTLAVVDDVLAGNVSKCYFICPYPEGDPFLFQFNSIQFNSIQFNSTQFNSIQFDAMQCNAMQCNPIQFNMSLMHESTCILI